MTVVMRTIELHCTSGGSDKIYKISLESEGANAYRVNYANGRRGGTMATGTKTQTPVALEAAKKMYEALKREKISKNYIPIGGTDFSGADKAEAIATMEKRSTGFLPQLLNPIGADQVERYITDDAYCAQLKYDGERRALWSKNDRVEGINRRGETTAVNKVLADMARELGRNFLIDGEIVGDNVYVFDILSYDDEDFRDQPLERRLDLLKSLFGIVSLNRDSSSIGLVGTALTTLEKRMLLKTAREQNREGVVFKKLDCKYAAGETPKSDDWVKFKFYKTLSAIVDRQNDKRSVALALVDHRGDRIQVGNVTIPTNATIPAVGAIIEVRYLYAYRNGSLFQPTYLSLRNDLMHNDCSEAQREYKEELAENPYHKVVA